MTARRGGRRGAARRVDVAAGVALTALLVVSGCGADVADNTDSANSDDQVSEPAMSTTAPPTVPGQAGALPALADEPLEVSLTTAARSGRAPTSSPASMSTAAPATSTTVTAPSTTTKSTSTSAAADTTAAETTATTLTVVDVERPVRVELVELTELDEPVDLLAAPGESALWVVERAGRVLRVDPATGETLGTVLDVSSLTTTQSERGLLGIEATDRWLYVSYTNLAGDSELWAYERSATELAALSGERRMLASVDQPFPNHNGGDVALDADGYLYWSLGDGGSANDPLGSGQDTTTLLGSIVRIEPTPAASAPYRVPPDNPFVDGVRADGSPARPEIWLYGARNIWRFSIDAPTGDLWAADVGQATQEEVNLLRGATGGGRGANLGWNVREGLLAFADAPDSFDAATLVDPLWVYGRNGGCSVTGGQVYRGTGIAGLAGAYVFGDYCTSRLWALRVTADGVETVDLGARLEEGLLASINVGHDGELYALSLAGPIYRVTAGS